MQQSMQCHGNNEISCAARCKRQKKLLKYRIVRVQRYYNRVATNNRKEKRRSKGLLIAWKREAGKAKRTMSFGYYGSIAPIARRSRDLGPTGSLSPGLAERSARCKCVHSIHSRTHTPPRRRQNTRNPYRTVPIATIALYIFLHSASYAIIMYTVGAWQLYLYDSLLSRRRRVVRASSRDYFLAPTIACRDPRLFFLFFLSFAFLFFIFTSETK